MTKRKQSREKELNGPATQFICNTQMKLVLGIMALFGIPVFLYMVVLTAHYWLPVLGVACCFGAISYHLNKPKLQGISAELRQIGRAHV